MTANFLNIVTHDDKFLDMAGKYKVMVRNIRYSTHCNTASVRRAQETR